MTRSAEFHEQVEGADGQVVACSLSLPDNHEQTTALPVVFIVHGFKGFKDWGFFPELARRIANAGLAAIRLNFSHNGVGLDADEQDFTRLDLFRRNRPSYELSDLLTAVDAVKNNQLFAAHKLDSDRIGFLGHSRGGPISILAGSKFEGAPVVTWASVRRLAWNPVQAEAFTNEGELRIPNARTGQIMTLDKSAYDDITPLPTSLDVNPALRKLGRRFLGLHGDQDQAVPLTSLDGLFEAAGQSVPEESTIAAADHVMNARHPYQGTTPELDQAISLSISHLRTHLVS